LNYNKKNQFLDLLCAVYFACDCFSGSVSGTAVARQELALLGLATAARFLSDFIFLALVFSRTSGLRARLYEDRFLLPWNLFLAAIHFGADIPTLLFPFRVRIGPPARRFRCLLDFPAQLASPRSWISDFVAALDPAKRAPGSSFLTRIFGPPARSRADFSSCFIDFRSRKVVDFSFAPRPSVCISRRAPGVILPLVLGFCSRGPSVVSAPRTCRSELFLVSTAGEENPAHVARLSLFLARSRAVHTDSIFVQPRVALSQF
jgi:hypothetical protein